MYSVGGAFYGAGGRWDIVWSVIPWSIGSRWCTIDQHHETPYGSVMDDHSDSETGTRTSLLQLYLRTFVPERRPCGRALGRYCARFIIRALVLILMMMLMLMLKLDSSAHRDGIATIYQQRLHHQHPRNISLSSINACNLVPDNLTNHAPDQPAQNTEHGTRNTQVGDPDVKIIPIYT